MKQTIQKGSRVKYCKPYFDYALGCYQQSQDQGQMGTVKAVEYHGSSCRYVVDWDDPLMAKLRGREMHNGWIELDET
jgi:hypothetical protein